MHSEPAYKECLEAILHWGMSKKPPLPHPDRRQTDTKGRAYAVERRGANRFIREDQSGEGSESALANLKKIQRIRARSKPADDPESPD